MSIDAERERRYFQLASSAGAAMPVEPGGLEIRGGVTVVFAFAD